MDPLEVVDGDDTADRRTACAGPDTVRRARNQRLPARAAGTRRHRTHDHSDPIPAGTGLGHANPRDPCQGWGAIGRLPLRAHQRLDQCRDHHQHQDQLRLHCGPSSGNSLGHPARQGRGDLGQHEPPGQGRDHRQDSDRLDRCRFDSSQCEGAHRPAGSESDASGRPPAQSGRGRRGPAGRLPRRMCVLPCGSNGGQKGRRTLRHRLRDLPRRRKQGHHGARAPGTEAPHRPGLLDAVDPQRQAQQPDARLRS